MMRAQKGRFKTRSGFIAVLIRYKLHNGLYLWGGCIKDLRCKGVDSLANWMLDGGSTAAVDFDLMAEIQ